MRPRLTLVAEQLAELRDQHPDHVAALTSPTALDVTTLAVMGA